MRCGRHWGLPPARPAQAVVDELLAAARALDDGDEARARTALGPPAFTAPADDTLRRLADLPYIRIANIATHEAEAAEAGPTSACASCQTAVGIPP